MWYGPKHFGSERARIEQRLEQLPGKQLVLVRYAPGHNPVNEWVYNLPDIDGSKVVWAREMDSDENRRLISYYRDRRVWLIEPDAEQVQLSPYPATDSPAG